MEAKKNNKTNQNGKRRIQPGMVTLIISVILIGLGALAIMIFLGGCSAQTGDSSGASHVFVFMGDGMGVNHVAAARYLEAAEEGTGISEKLRKEDSFDSFPNIGWMYTHNAQMDVTDSSAAATAMFTGRKTDNEALNCDPQTGETFTPLAKRLSQAGYAVGVVSTTSLEHASPAALYAVSEDRYDYTDIARQGIGCGWLDFWGAGGFLWDQEEMEEEARQAGFTVANTPEAIRELNAASLPAIAAAANDAADPYMAYEIDRERSAYYGTDSISFGELVSQAIACLGEEEKFFLFAEAGKVDTASAMLDLKSALYEVKALDAAVAEALAFYEKKPEDTLILVLSDHETGGLRLRTGMDLSKLEGQVASAVRFRGIMEELYDGDASFEAAMEKAAHYFGIREEDLDPDTLVKLEGKYQDAAEGTYSEDELDPFTTELCQIMAEAAQISFASGSHTAQPVAVYALGKGAETFSGVYDNTEIYGKLMDIMKMEK